MLMSSSSIPFHLAEEDTMLVVWVKEIHMYAVNKGCLDLVYHQSEKVKMLKFYEIIVVTCLKMDPLFLCISFFC